MAYLSRAQMLEARRRRYEDLEVPEWGGRVRLQSLLAGERDDYEARALEQRGGDSVVNLANMRARLVVLVLVDEKGQRVWKDEEAEEVGRMDAKPIDRIFKHAQHMNGMSREDVDFFAKGSSTMPSSSSSSSSPSPSAAPGPSSSSD